jgi:hypothetical protein
MVAHTQFMHHAGFVVDRPICFQDRVAGLSTVNLRYDGMEKWEE